MTGPCNRCETGLAAFSHSCDLAPPVGEFGVVHGDPCPDCGGAAFHGPGCQLGSGAGIRLDVVALIPDAPPLISDRAARTLAVIRGQTLSVIARQEWFAASHDDEDAWLADLDEVIRACGRDPQTIGRLL